MLIDYSITLCFNVIITAALSGVLSYIKTKKGVLIEPILLALFFVSLLSSLLSGIAGGGGGFIMAPFWLLAGMTPAQGATTGAFMAIGIGSGSVFAYRGTGHLPRDKRLVLVLLGVTLVTSLVGPFFLQRLSVDAFKPLLAFITLLSLPLLFIDRQKLRFIRGGSRTGYVVMGLLLLLSSFITSSAFSILMAVALTRLFGLSTLGGTALRRLIGIVQSLVLFIVLSSLGNFLPLPSLIALLGGVLGSFVGTRISLARGEHFAKYALALGAVIGVIALLVRV